MNIEQIKEEELRQYFKNHFDGYINTIDESVVLAMDEDGFVKAVKEFQQRAFNAALVEFYKEIYMNDEIVGETSIEAMRKIRQIGMSLKINS